MKNFPTSSHHASVTVGRIDADPFPMIASSAIIALRLDGSPTFCIIESATVIKFTPSSLFPLMTRSSLFDKFLYTFISRTFVSYAFFFSTQGAIFPSAFAMMRSASALFFADWSSASDSNVCVSTLVFASSSAASFSDSAVIFSTLSCILSFTRCTSRLFSALILLIFILVSSLMFASDLEACAILSFSFTCSAFMVSAPDVISCSLCSWNV
mmetsp:Transcript_19767/g.27135  ORF Transcript_19767/g.27135 Transcript_19767/m.27135 type:complete len:212 (-) Transcript_19767:928-1563(-)